MVKSEQDWSKRRTFEEPKPRSYQIEVLKRAEMENTIVCMETGCGKTLISVLLIRSLSSLFRKPERGICIFLAPTVPLCQQQAEVIERYTDLFVGSFFGGSSTNSNHESWIERLQEYEVFVMIPEILLRNLRHGFFKREIIELLIFDECHHAAKGHPYANIMMEFYHQPSVKCPRIFGMTASPVIGKGRTSGGPKGFRDAIEHLEDMLVSKIYSVMDKKELDMYAPSSNLKIRHYEMDFSAGSVEFACQSKMNTLFETTSRKLLECGLLEERRALNQTRTSLEYCLFDLGLWCAKQAAQVLLKDCTENTVKGAFLTHVLNIFEEAGLDELEVSYPRENQRGPSDFRRSLMKFLTGDIDPRQQMPGTREISTKVQLLLDVLDPYKDSKDLQCIVFVERAIAVKVLSLLLNLLPFITCQCLASHRTNLKGMSRTYQTNVLEDFRAGKINLLIATNVAEEGLDIQSCFLVIRFDLPKTERSNIQSRGRARQPGSDYVILVESGNLEQEKFLKSILLGEKLMQEEVNRVDTSRNNYVDYREKEAYRVESTGAAVNIDSSVSLLHQYCSTLKCNDKSNAQPEFYFWKDVNGIVCKIKLPDIAEVNNIVGLECGTEDMAKRFASLEACKKLHIVGALSDHLLPFSSRHKTDMKIEDSDAKEGMELHETVIPDALGGSVEISSGVFSLYTYVLSIVPTTDNRPYRNFALCLPNCLNESAGNVSIQLDLGRGRKVTIELLPAGRIDFDSMKVFWAKHFHEKVYSTILEYNFCRPQASSATWHSSRAYFLLPLLPGELTNPVVDWDCVQRVASPVSSAEEAEKKILRFANCSVPITEVQGGLVLTKHNEGGTLYCILGTLDNMNSDSPYEWNPMYSSYSDYFSKRYNLNVEHPEQPLLHVKRLKRIRNYLLQRSKNELSSSPSTSCELPPDLCTVQILGLSYSILNSITLLPSFMHRLEGLLASIQLRDKIGAEVSEGIRTSAATIMTALTAASCNENVSLERMELLGDSFLKFAASFHLYAAYPEKREGFLSRKRAEETSNKNLHRLAILKNLAIYIREGQFDPDDWVVPGFSPRLLCDNSNVCANYESSKMAQKCDKGHRWLSRKAIADVVEALIGGCIVDDSADAAYLFIRWLGLELRSECVIPMHSSRMIKDKKLDKLEEIIKYSFRNKDLLVEAFSHASHNKVSYQRLEYLGDAILDYLIVLHLYATFPFLQPGLLNDLKSATVNNEWFAYVAVRHTFHSYLLHSSGQLTREIQSFLSKSTDSFEDWQVDKPPKVLSDLVESLAAALFLDTQGDLFRVWKVFKPILDPIASPENLLLHPVRELQELCQSKGFVVEYIQSGELHCKVEVSEETTIVGSAVSRNGKVAKKQAAVDALTKLKALGFEHPRHALMRAIKSEGSELSSVNPAIEEGVIGKGLKFHVEVIPQHDENQHGESVSTSSQTCSLPSETGLGFVHTAPTNFTCRPVGDNDPLGDLHEVQNGISLPPNAASSLDDIGILGRNGFSQSRQTCALPPETGLGFVHTAPTNFTYTSGADEDPLGEQCSLNGISLPQNAASSLDDILGRTGCSQLLSDEHASSVNEIRGVEVGRPRALLQEFCKKFKWVNPIYTCCEEGGPSHMKQFTFAVAILVSSDNCIEFTGDPMRDVRRAKDSAASYALEWLQGKLGVVINAFFQSIYQVKSSPDGKTMELRHLGFPTAAPVFVGFMACPAVARVSRDPFSCTLSPGALNNANVKNEPCENETGIPEGLLEFGNGYDAPETEEEDYEDCWNSVAKCRNGTCSESLEEHHNNAGKLQTEPCNGDLESLPLPQKFVEFLERQNVDPRVYHVAHSLPRYIRLKPSAHYAVEEIEEELGATLEPVSWLPGFFKIPSQAHISCTAAYKHGRIYGMDAASGAAVAALGIQSGDHVLDVCAAPGAKLCMIAELLDVTGRGTLTGVDISRPRLAACRTMLQKYGLGSRSRLFLADGTTFSVLPLRDNKQASTSDISEDCRNHRSSYLMGEGSLVFTEWRPRRTRKEKRAEQRAIWQENEKGVTERKEPEIFFYGKQSGVVGMQLSSILNYVSTGTDHIALKDGYDKVLVDAECTHDGSLKHICKFEQWGWETFEKRFFNSERISSITDLQLKLLSNGFRLLKQGGTLVYSTCSFTWDQNEGVVKRFLSTHLDAELREIEAAASWPCKRGELVHCVHFDPFVSNTNGQFIAKIAKG